MSSESTAPIEAARIEELEQQLYVAQLKIQVLEDRLRLQRIAKYGPGSEKLNDAQLQLLELEPGVSGAEIEAESRREPITEFPDHIDRHQNGEKKRTHPGRQELPASLPRVEKLIACPAEHRCCSACGGETAVIGYTESEQLDLEPAKYFVRVTRREKRACKHCAESGVRTAPVPERVIDKCLVSDRIVIGTIVAKYSDHLPLYRQSAILARETGIAIGRATMDGWVMRVGDLLVPIAAAMRRELLRGSYIQADETPVDVQLHDGKGQNHQAYLWQYGTPGAGVVFDFRLGRAREGPKQFLGNFEGLLQTDGYAAYEQVGGPRMVHAVCWAHARRKFVEAVKLNPGDRAAARLVASIDRLFAIDAQARERKLDPAARHLLRMEQAAPLLGTIRRQIETALAGALPASALAKAAKYTLVLWKKLARFLEYPELELSNNLAENSMRPIALGRKNWIHLGSRQAGPKVAAILSVIETCRRLDVSARDYMASILPGLADTSLSKLPHLTPAAWAARNR